MRALQALTLAISLAMTYIAVTTSLESNLFEVGGELLEIPWMVATLWDFYFNILLFFLWVAYRERRWWVAALWLVSFVCLGGIATAFYVFVQITRLQPGQGMEELLLGRHARSGKEEARC